MPFKDWLDFSFAWPNPGGWLYYALRSEFMPKGRANQNFSYAIHPGSPAWR
jgi:hypothetical protein